MRLTMRRTNCCHGFLAFNLKFFNFFQFFVGVSLVVYSLYALSQWQNRAPVVPPPSIAPVSDSSVFSIYKSDALAVRDRFDQLASDVDLVSGSDELADLGFVNLPATWFIYCLMGFGVILCTISCICHIAAEAINGCCLCFYTLLMTILLFLEGVMVAFIAFNHNWEKVLPYDPTSELDLLKDFIKENSDLCKWVGRALLASQVLSLLLAFILKAMVTSQRANSDIEENYTDLRDGNREPLLKTQPGQSSASTKGDVRTNLSDIWSSRIRGKYGLNGVNSNYAMNQNPPVKMTSIDS